MKKTFVLSLAIAFASVFAIPSFAQEGAEKGPNWTPMYEGVELASYPIEDPLMKVVVARIDLQASGIEFRATVPNENFEKETRETTRRTTAQFLKDRDLSVAINGNFYTPFNASTIVSEGDANLSGLGVADGFVESDPINGFPSFVVMKDGGVEIAQYQVGDDLSNIQQAVSGNMIVLKDGQVLEFGDKAKHPRTAVGYSQDKRYVYFMTIDGRQPNFSMGATYEQLAEQLKYVGAYQGLNLDGGGSTTFVVRDAQGEPVVLNRPINSTPDRLRHNANGIGVAAKGAPQAEPTGFRL